MHSGESPLLIALPTGLIIAITQDTFVNKVQIFPRRLARIRMFLLPSRLSQRDVRMAISSRCPVRATTHRSGWEWLYSLLAPMAFVKRQEGRSL